MVFESGGLTPKENWDTLLAYLPKDWAWMTYDRPGIGQSEEDTTLQNDAAFANHLHRFLQAVKAWPPYVLIGHSYGGPLIRMFSALYPSEVNGLVFIDPTVFQWSKEDEEELKRVAHSDIGFVGMLEKMYQVMASSAEIPAGARSEMKRIVYKDAYVFYKDYDSLPPLQNMPVTVFVAYNAPPDPETDQMMKRLNINRGVTDEYNKMRIQHYLEYIENNSQAAVVCLPQFTHYMHLQDPARIAAGIQDVYKRAVGKEKPKPALRQ